MDSSHRFLWLACLLRVAAFIQSAQNLRCPRASGAATVRGLQSARGWVSWSCDLYGTFRRVGELGTCLGVALPPRGCVPCLFAETPRLPRGGSFASKAASSSVQCAGIVRLLVPSVWEGARSGMLAVQQHRPRNGFCSALRCSCC